jgi:ligand-binding sensor domain-containing protein
VISNKTGWILVAALIAGCLPSWGASASGSPEEPTAALPGSSKASSSDFIISFWSTGEGLPVNEILDLAETPDGYLWLGTHHGLVRFDGVRFETFFRTPRGMRYGARVAPLEVDGHGRLWAAPDANALVYREEVSFSDVLTNAPFLRVRVDCLCSDGTNGVLWVDERGGLGRVSAADPNRAQRVPGPSAPGSRWLRDFEGRLWLAGPRNLHLLEKAGWRNLGMPTTTRLVATPRRAGGLWFAREARLRVITADGNRSVAADFPWRNQSRVTRMLEDRSGRLWIGTESQGLFCYAAGQFKQVVPMANVTSCLLEDSQGNIWAGTVGRGVVRLRPRHLFVQDLRGGLPNEFVRSLAQDRDGRVWLVTNDGGLGWWQNGAWRSLDRADGWPRLDAYCVYPAKDGGVWISTVKRSLWRWADGRFSEVDLGPGRPKEPAVDLMEDRQGRLWMVTDNSGLYCLSGTNLAAYTTSSGLPSERMRRVIQDEAGDIWAGDWQGGIARFAEGKWQIARQSSSHRDLVRSLITAEGALWIGTEASGLLRFKHGRTDSLSVEQGLPDNCLQQLLADGHGSLWAATPHQLFQVSFDQLNAVLDGRLDRVHPTSYGRSDGVPAVSFGDWFDPRCWRATDGELWFATANGAIHFNPGDLQQGRAPHVLVEQTRLDGRPVTAAA